MLFGKPEGKFAVGQLVGRVDGGIFATQNVCVKHDLSGEIVWNNHGVHDEAVLSVECLKNKYHSSHHYDNSVHTHGEWVYAIYMALDPEIEEVVTKQIEIDAIAKIIITFLKPSNCIVIITLEAVSSYRSGYRAHHYLTLWCNDVLLETKKVADEYLMKDIKFYNELDNLQKYQRWSIEQHSLLKYFVDNQHLKHNIQAPIKRIKPLY